MNRRTVGLIGSGLAFMALLIDAKGAYQLASLDTSVLVSLQDLWSEPLKDLVLWFTALSGHVAVPVFGIVLMIYLAIRRDWNNLGFAFSALIGSLFLFSFFKAWVGRARPSSMIYDPGLNSFPSGHAAMSTIMGLLVYFIFKSSVSEQRRRLFLLSCFLFPVLISFTRIFLNVHYPTDVVAGVAISMSWIILLTYIYHPDEVSKTKYV